MNNNFPGDKVTDLRSFRQSRQASPNDGLPELHDPETRVVGSLPEKEGSEPQR